ncbi:MAG: HTH domain-containing protein [Bacteroidota bacterium]
MKLIHTLKRIERIDQLIRLKATGRPGDLAKRLNISVRSVYQTIDMMKEMGAEIYYCSQKRSYCYEGDMKFIYGFKSRQVKQAMGHGRPSVNYGCSA